MTAANPLVMQIVAPKIGGSPRPMSTGEIQTLSQARAIIAANHTTALSLGYTSTLEAGHNWVRYVRPLSPSIEVLQFFVPVGKMFYEPPKPMTGDDPHFAPITPPAVGAGTEVILDFGQSNADFSGTGRKTAPVSLTGGAGCYAFGPDSLYYTCSDPMAGGWAPGGRDAGPWARLAKRSLGKIALNGATINRVVIASRAVGGSFIDYWAAPNTFGGTSSSLVTVTSGSRTFTIVPSVAIFPFGSPWRARSTISGAFMDGSLTNYDSGTNAFTMTVFNTSGSGTFNDWTIRPLFGNGEGYTMIRAEITNMINHGIAPTKIAFAQGESAIGAPRDWNDAIVSAAYWTFGFQSMINGLRATPPLALATPVYTAQTTICNVRDVNTSQANIDAIANKTPDSHTSAEMGREQIRLAQFARFDGVGLLHGANLDSIGPPHREDGCHISARGLDEGGRLWSLAFYGAE